MKGFSTLLILSAVLALTGCGKENESGKSGNSGVCLQYGVNGQCSNYSSYTAGYSGTVNLSGIVSQIPCYGSNYGGVVNRSQVTIPVQTTTLASAGQSYLGVTSLGDIIIVQGTGSYQAQATIFMCNGQQVSQQMGAVQLGEYTDAACPIKVVTVATFNGGMTRFRDPRDGLPTQQFSFCHR